MPCLKRVRDWITKTYINNIDTQWFYYISFTNCEISIPTENYDHVGHAMLLAKKTNIKAMAYEHAPTYRWCLIYILAYERICALCWLSR